ncbi:CopG family transcriptional regulator [Acidithiobacillus thiooxidans]|uniref:CopG family transcriptional regulator n=1 Tax=Acidithiobacillus thiooxidans TaxID=930 RepID=A0A1C2HVL0_ACITH|nr:CopG family ribbon-helix-helix protein [Acidithiobacillus thiooxidans]OCX67740.1 CopG family transcriptional regulator [Acidithiobacillus thiooxidans]OCX75298.1 CopG family transcriptional regulator [Acidithiobacillus thiooxidans]OCX77830.1 CopG family transcriptional regulator [Acidithiobacillus thiooxidans]OCX80559.1 CopG family transcriptional regulator [Acidithiobacillus thiooxidans]OCX81384.1 CopG family transcriptional regulator [Acidithiobacillus thiooxidans]
MPATAAKTVSVKLDNDIRDRIRHLADVRHRTTHWIMRQAIEEYVEREEKREAFRQGTLKAWEEYQETDLHVTGDEVIAWLETWGDDNEQTAPACHK